MGRVVEGGVVVLGESPAAAAFFAFLLQGHAIIINSPHATQYPSTPLRVTTLTMSQDEAKGDSIGVGGCLDKRNS